MDNIVGLILVVMIGFFLFADNSDGKDTQDLLHEYLTQQIEQGNE